MNLETTVSFLDANKIKYILNFPMFKLSSFELGGIARIIEYPETMQDFCNSICFLHQNNIKFYILGKSTNTFFSDDGFDGVVLCTKYLNKVLCEGEVISAMCGAEITDASMLALSYGLSGMEFCCGIPGSVGGAIYMNAGAFEKSVSELVLESEVFDLSSNKRYSINYSEHLFDKKRSVFSENRKLVLLSTKFKLSPSSKSKIYSDMRRITIKRIDSQPLESGNCGSTFKRPLNAYASKLIDEAGLKGKRIGGVEVSKKHAGFIVNVDNNACASDASKLIELIQKEVYEKFNVSLEEEIIFVK